MKLIAFLVALIAILWGEFSASRLVERGKQGHRVMSEIANSSDRTSANARFKDEETRLRFRKIDDQLSSAMHWGVDMIPVEHRFYANVVRFGSWSFGILVVCFAFFWDWLRKAKRFRAQGGSASRGR